MPRPKGSSNRSELVQLALAGIDAQIQQLQVQIDALADKRKQLARTGSGQAGAATVLSKGRKAAAVAADESSKKKRVVSAATRKKLKEAAKARWAKARGESAE